MVAVALDIQTVKLLNLVLNAKLEFCQISKMEYFAKNSWIIFEKRSILDV